MKDIFIYGTGGLAMEVAWLIEDINKEHHCWNLRGYIDDQNPHKWGQYLYNYQVLGGNKFLREAGENCALIIAIGNPRARRQVVEDELHDLEIHYPILIHPSVLMSPSVKIGEGTVVAARNTITVEVKLGRHVFLNLSCTIGHGAVIGDYCVLHPGVHVSGDVTVGRCTMIGTGAQLIQGTQVGAKTIIGAWAVVIRHVPDCVVAVGNPTRIVNSK